LFAFRRYKKNGTQKKGNTNTPPNTLNYPQLTKDQRNTARKKTINDKYMSMEREVKIKVVNTIPVDDRARLAVHLAMQWYYNESVRSGAAWH
jgi:hypothetical protein